MPLLAFPGGYGGMVWSDTGRLSLSCCIRRDVLSRIRAENAEPGAGEAVLRHILANCSEAAAVLRPAHRDGEWLAAGPIRPGERSCFADGLFRVGNIAGESHPIIAEGISMAMQSAWLLAIELGRELRWDEPARQRAALRYAAAWRRQFAYASLSPRQSLASPPAPRRPNSCGSSCATSPPPSSSAPA